MLTKKDLQQIEEIVQRRINNDVPVLVKSAFQDFYEHIFEPYVNKNESEHSQMVAEIKSIKKDTEEIKEHVKDHDKRLTEVEKLSLIKN